MSKSSCESNGLLYHSHVNRLAPRLPFPLPRTPVDRRETELPPVERLETGDAARRTLGGGRGHGRHGNARVAERRAVVRVEEDVRVGGVRARTDRRGCHARRDRGDARRPDVAPRGGRWGQRAAFQSGGHGQGGWRDGPRGGEDGVPVGLREWLGHSRRRCG